MPIVLFHFEDKTYQEIAEPLGVSLAKVKTDIHRGREALRIGVDSDPWIPLIATTASIAR